MLKLGKPICLLLRYCRKRWDMVSMPLPLLPKPCEEAHLPPNILNELQAKVAPALLFSLQGRCDFGLSAPSNG